MTGLFDGFDEILDAGLCLDETWDGKPPYYRHWANLLRLCEQNDIELDGLKLIHELFDRLTANCLDSLKLHAKPPSPENWRFRKQLEMADHNVNPETTLERTIAVITDDNWANQVPTVSGLAGASPHHLDLCHRTGSEYTLFELKVEADTPLCAAFQVVRYGLAYAFSRTHAELLEYKTSEKELLRATALHLRVLAPTTFYPDNDVWLLRFERSLNAGLARFSSETSDLQVPMDFRFEAFPEWFDWKPESCQNESARKDLLWALHRRQPVFDGQ